MRCMECSKIVIAGDAWGHFLKTGHNRWEILIVEKAKV